MSKLEELKQIVKEQFDKAETKEQIDCFAAIKQKFDEVSKEQEQIEQQNAELIKSYKDLVQQRKKRLQQLVKQLQEQQLNQHMLNIK